MLVLQNISYSHPNKDLLFHNLGFSVGDRDKVALIGNNGSGKSTLLQIIAGLLHPSEGQVQSSSPPYYIPQLFGQFNELTIAEALRIDQKLKSLHEILEGNVSETNLSILNDDWIIEERCSNALAFWKLEGLQLNQQMKTLSGGQKTKVFLAGIAIHKPGIILLDEPSNHLDTAGRKLLYEFVSSVTTTLIVVSHDRKLLNLLDSVYELSKHGITVYGGNYDFYSQQKLIEANALDQDLRNVEKTLRKAKEIERESIERQNKLNAKGKKKQEKSGLPTISMNTLRNKAEKSTAKLKNVHTEKLGAISEERDELRKSVADMDKMKFGFNNTSLHKGKILFDAREINYHYGKSFLWETALTLVITSGERIAIKGSNGSGKTTLIKLILGDLEPSSGVAYRAIGEAVYIDQDYSLINNDLTVYEQAAAFNNSGLQEHEIKIRLNRFLFSKEFWDKKCEGLSGGEKMRLMLCCLTIAHHAPDLVILDEPTNNLDIRNIEILTAAINEYQGTLIVVSHDQYFLEEINVVRTIDLD
ncbi:ABC-F family ATP-binding cassette domain-containing protein [Flavitalea sp.]|nr:ABC-F family ATP-binding cassette domain-containing protein [Flavitalea sp.]